MPGLVKSFECDSSGHGAVANDRDHPARVMVEVCGHRHSQAGRNGRGGMPDTKGIMN